MSLCQGVDFPVIQSAECVCPPPACTVWQQAAEGCGKVMIHTLAPMIHKTTTFLNTILFFTCTKTSPSPITL